MIYSFPESYVVYIHIPLISLHKYRSVYENNRRFRKPYLQGPPLSCTNSSVMYIIMCCMITCCYTNHIDYVDNVTTIISVVIVSVIVMDSYCQLLLNVDNVTKQGQSNMQYSILHMMYVMYMYIYIYIYTTYTSMQVMTYTTYCQHGDADNGMRCHVTHLTVDFRNFMVFCLAETLAH